MKDLIIPGQRIARELRMLLVCFVAALLVNAGAIIAYHTEWKEMFTALHVTVGVALVFYMLLGVFRLIGCGVARLFGRKKA